MSQQPASGGTPNAGLLSRYLDDHLLAATGGVRLFQAAQRSWRGTEHEKVFARLFDEISEDREELLRLIRSLGFSPNKAKMAFAQVSAQLGKVNPINPLRSDKGEGAQLELESLQSAIRGKECLWETLLTLARAGIALPPLTTSQLESLLVRAQEQQRDVADVMRSTAEDRFRNRDS